MKNKILSMMILFMVAINGIDPSTKIDHQNPSTLTTIRAKVESFDNFFLRESIIPENAPLRALKELFPQKERESFFFSLASKSKNITSVEALDIFIRSAAQSIIDSPEYRGCASIEEGINPFYNLIEDLDPICRTYMRRAWEIQQKG